MSDAAEILRDLQKPWHVHVHSSSQLAGLVEAKAGKIDAAHRKKGDEPPLRKARLTALPAAEAVSPLKITPWQVLHTLGRATVLSRQGAGRGLAEHWGCLKYCQALTGNRASYMAISTDGQNAKYHHKTVQSEELGIGFALAAAERVIHRRLPGYTLSIIDADIALQAGWALAGKEVRQRDGVKLRPDYFIEARSAGRPPKVIVVECKGTHQPTPHVYTQLAKASSQVQSVQVGKWGTTPSLMIATELMAQSGITIHILDPEGDGTLHTGEDDSDISANHPAPELNIFPRVRVPGHGDMPETTAPGFQVGPESYGWFRRVLARTAAAGLMAFAGDGESAAELLTKRQGERHFRGYVHPGTGIVRDVSHAVRGLTFTGTDLVFRLNGTRVEAFSGVSEPLYRMLAEGDVDRYRGQAPEEFATWHSRGDQNDWAGPVSMHEDGSIMAMRIVPRH